jgi:multidrug resistance efflux pump
LTDAEFEKSRTQVDALQTAIVERSNLLQVVESNLKNFILPESVRNTLNPVQAAVDVQEAKLKELKASYGPRFLYAPMDGVVSLIHHHSGESVLAGDAIITVSSVQSEQIVAFVRQPLIYSPKIGMAVRVRARTPHRETGEANIIQVGSQMEAYSTVMLPFTSTRPQEWGLPVMVSLPAGLKVVPGELVDIVFQAKPEK